MRRRRRKRKGKIERPFRDLKAGFLAEMDLDPPADVGELNRRAETWLARYVIDDVGITPFDRNQANAFFQVVNRRYENRSATIVTTNRGLPAWAELFGGDSVVAAAILTDSSTVPPSSTSKPPPGGYADTKPSPNPSPSSTTHRSRPRPSVANLTPEHDLDRDFR